GTFTHTFTPSAALAPDTYTVTISGNTDDAGGDVQQVPTSWSFTVGAADVTPPTAPTGLAAGTVTDTSVVLTWDAHPNTDGDLAGFNVYRDGVLIATVTDPLATSYTDATASAGTSYIYTITAVDTSGNESAASNAVNVTTSNSTTGSTPPISGELPPVFWLNLQIDRSFVLVGDTFVLTITITNPRGDVVKNIRVETIIPRLLRIIGMTSTHGTPIAMNTSGRSMVSITHPARVLKVNRNQPLTQDDDRTITLDIAELQPGESAVMTITLEVPTTLNQDTLNIQSDVYVDGKVMQSLTQPLIVVRQLPATGETPWWRGFALMGSAVTLFISITGVTLALRRRILVK
ncbi:MAG: hypothetical protein CUN56_13560, partial [Phototrophicales bacterium]